MAWIRTDWTNDDIVEDDFAGGTRLRLSFPDGSVVIGKLTVAPNLRPTRTSYMVRLMTSFSGDTWVHADEADVDIWVTDAFPASSAD
ncbi:hypothetical protein [Microbacterium sp. 77mftsu3.1]|uniref:hypothetical protein n=1 Tax=Microbacterium sp. 77mftsu3.1 TaxID=1761802 RepID=UPI000365C5A8|nr:hypothetical protein [Microbacterium sp. 77mftsu3.1]SDH50619.1 hypothetical protein SAMN04488590_3472 [Microbacterium sp. 77mftsu3.1]